MSEKDIFCKIISGEIETEKLDEDDFFIAIKDINPKAQIHYLIIPKKHVESVAFCEAEDTELVGRMIMFAKSCAEKLKLEGYKLNFNVGKKGGQEIEHIHLHLLGGKYF